MSYKLAVIGQGYVGLPLSIAAAESGYKTLGIDLDLDKISSLNVGKSLVEDVTDQQLRSLIKKSMYKATSDYSELIGIQIIVICVPTPLTDSNEPDVSFIESAIKSMAKYIAKNALIILESTVGPGTTRNYLVPLLENESGISREDFFVAFSPERIDPSNKIWNIKRTPKIVSGLNKKSTERAVKFYSQFVDSTIECESLEVAETAKLLENAFRLINISFVNELSIFCQKLGIDINQVVKAAATKPYGFMPFYPSIGIGGHCIPVDPVYLSSAAKLLGVPTKLIDLAYKINKEMPIHFIGRAADKIGNLKDKRILIVGVAYKPNVADIRETPVEVLISGLKENGAIVYWHDNLVKEWKGEKSVEISSDYDLAILTVPHDYLDLSALGDVPILNTRGSI
jgi:UDP-N-acetyl-D-glucosamine dehydrogenase